MSKKQWNILLKFKKGKKNAKNMQKNHWKTLFSSKNLLGKETKEEEKRQKKGGGRLLGEGRILGTIRYLIRHPVHGSVRRLKGEQTSIWDVSNSHTLHFWILYCFLKTHMQTHFINFSLLRWYISVWYSLSYFNLYFRNNCSGCGEREREKERFVRFVRFCQICQIWRC